MRFVKQVLQEKFELAVLQLREPVKSVIDVVGQVADELDKYGLPVGWQLSASIQNAGHVPHAGAPSILPRSARTACPPTPGSTSVRRCTA